MRRFERENLMRFLCPRAIAVVGATARPEALGHIVLNNLLVHGFAGPIYPVNPRYDEVLDLPCYKSLANLPGPIDAVVLAVPAAAVLNLVDQAATAGAGGVCVIAAGFADAGREGAELQEALAIRMAAHGMAGCGPNNMGLINLWDRTVMWISDLPNLEPGPVAVISQSGGFAVALSQDPRSLGIGYLVTVGSEAVCDVADYMDALAEDDRVSTILLCLESLRRPRAFAKAAEKAIEAGQHLIALKVGRSEVGRAAVAAHSGALAGEDQLVQAFFRDLGIIQVHDLDEMLEAASLVTAHGNPPSAQGVGIVTVSGGEAAMIADVAEGLELDLPQPHDAMAVALRDVLPSITNISNPLDIWGFGWDAEVFAEALSVLLEDERLGTILCFGDPPLSGGNDMEHIKEMAENLAGAALGTDKRLVLANSMATVEPHPEIAAVMNAAGLPYLRGTKSTLQAVRSWLAATERRGGRPIIETVDIGFAPSEPEMFDLLHTAGVPMTRVHTVTGHAETRKVAAKLGYPVALKGTAPGLLHKTEHDLVCLGIADPAALDEAVTKIETELAKLGHKDTGMVLQAMVPPGVELYVGVRNDQGYGSLIVVGLGGVFVEALADVSCRIGPVDPAEARVMLSETRASILLAGFRGAQKSDVDSAAEAISALSHFGVAVAAHVASVEINPLIVLPDGVIGVDAAFELHGETKHEL